jgi:hypothetical protein
MNAARRVVRWTTARARPRRLGPLRLRFRALRARTTRWLDQAMTRRQGLPAYVLLSAGVVLAFALDSHQDAQRARELCQSRADYSKLIVGRFTVLVDTLEIILPGDPLAGILITTIRDDLAANLPPLDPATC